MSGAISRRKPGCLKMAKNESELTVITKAKELCTYIMTVTQKSPKQFRYTFLTRMQNLSLSVIENLFRANDIYPADSLLLKERRNFQQQALTDIKILAYFSMLAMEQKCILPKQFEQIARLTEDCRFLTAGWISSDQKRFKP